MSNNLPNGLAELIAKRVVKPLHQRTVSGGRIQRLAHYLNQILPADPDLTGLDVGCGSGVLAKTLMQTCPQVNLSGVEVLVRPGTEINVTQFDGITLPFADKSFDFTILVDVLHHTDDPAILMQECVRVSRQFVLVKDHVQRSWWDIARLRFMDWVGNRGYDVYLPYNYLSEQQWQALYQQVGLTCEARLPRLELYPPPLSYLFGGQLHFVARLKESDPPS
jgi:SAM-dependent methyltransferase